MKKIYKNHNKKKFIFIDLVTRNNIHENLLIGIYNNLYKYFEYFIVDKKISNKLKKKK